MKTLPAPNRPPRLRYVTPVRARSDGWTTERQRRFIAALADCGNVEKAAARAGMSKQSAYNLRRHPAAADFRRAWEAALAEAWRRVEETALDRALCGELEVYDRDGVQVTRHKPCAPRLLVHLLDRAERARIAARQIADREAAQLQQAAIFRVRDQIRALAENPDLAETADDEIDAAAEAEAALPKDGESIALRDFQKLTQGFPDRSDIFNDFNEPPSEKRPKQSSS